MSSSPAQAEPDVKDVKTRVDRLYREAEQASERYNAVKIQLDDLKADLGSVKADEKRAETSLDAMRREARRSVLRQSGGGDLGLVSQVATAGDVDGFLSDVSTLSTYRQLQQSLFDDYATGLQALSLRRDATEDRIAQVAKLEKKLATEKSTVDDKLGDAKELLGELQADERAALQAAEARETRTPQPPAGTQDRPDTTSRDTTTRTPPDVPVSGRASAAVQYALAQVGDAYVHGAAGPDAFDCSGLTMMAWAQAGVSLPHSSSAQSGTGTPVAASDLQPGDLVFYYSPISHVGIFIGNGQIVDAANPGTGVRIASVFSMPFSGAVRPG
ncbi:C40 family peptidase [Nocardioides plantarum]|uniref:NlpC/P60 family protein n=1 Tax=Nocardioides plantarum TaxID=29299 RepID=A0ABV5KE92_9ACTN|nr:C40 family peptidase [Nocardioides plantarum]